jgi:hypothetical protein
MALATHPFDIYGTDAQDLRLLLEARAQDGVAFTERRHWLMWRRFTVTAPPGVLESLKVQVDQLATDLWGERQF